MKNFLMHTAKYSTMRIQDFRYLIMSLHMMTPILLTKKETELWKRALNYCYRPELHKSARNLIHEGTQGDATFRSDMNWDAIDSDEKTQLVLSHWQKLGKFRKDHPAVGAGKHKMISKAPYLFQRTYDKNEYKDQVLIGLDLNKGPKKLNVANVFVCYVNVEL